MEQIIGTEQQIQPSKAELEKLVLDMAALQRDVSIFFHLSQMVVTWYHSLHDVFLMQANAIVMERRQQSIIGKSLDDKAAFFHVCTTYLSPYSICIVYLRSSF